MKDGSLKFNPDFRIDNCVKRSAKEVERDAVIISELLFSGVAIQDVPKELQERTNAPYRLLYSQVVSVVEDAFRVWWNGSTKSIADRLVGEIFRLEQVEAEAWKCHNESFSGVRIATTDFDFIDEVTTIKGKQKTSGKVKRITGVGKADWLTVIMRCVEQRTRLYLELAKLGNTEAFVDTLKIEFIRHDNSGSPGV